MICHSNRESTKTLTFSIVSQVVANAVVKSQLGKVEMAHGKGLNSKGLMTKYLQQGKFLCQADCATVANTKGKKCKGTRIYFGSHFQKVQSVTP